MITPAVSYPAIIERLARHFSHFPGVGRRTGLRMALAALEWKEEELSSFADDLRQLHSQVRHCSLCGNYTEEELCGICASPARNCGQICVVEQASQIAVFEKAGIYHGRYHVLGGRISPLSGIGPEDLRISELRQRLESGEADELILATNPDVEGEATARYLTELFRGLPVSISRLASGVPAGSEVGTLDPATLALALNGRHQV